MFFELAVFFGQVGAVKEVVDGFAFEAFVAGDDDGLAVIVGGEPGGIGIWDCGEGAEAIYIGYFFLLRKGSADGFTQTEPAHDSERFRGAAVPAGERVFFGDAADEDKVEGARAGGGLDAIGDGAKFLTGELQGFFGGDDAAGGGPATQGAEHEVAKGGAMGTGEGAGEFVGLCGGEDRGPLGGLRGLVDGEDGLEAGDEAIACVVAAAEAGVEEEHRVLVGALLQHIEELLPGDAAGHQAFCVLLGVDADEEAIGAIGGRGAVADKNKPEGAVGGDILGRLIGDAQNRLAGGLLIAELVDLAYAKAVPKVGDPVAAGVLGAVDGGKEQVVLQSNHDRNVALAGVFDVKGGGDVGVGRLGPGLGAEEKEKNRIARRYPVFFVGIGIFFNPEKRIISFREVHSVRLS